MIGLRISVIFALLLSVGCGYHLRGVGGGANFNQSLFVEGLDASDPFVSKFRDALTIAGGRLESLQTKAGGIVHIYHATHIRRSLAVTQFGRSTEYDLFFRVVYDVRNNSGEVVLPKQEIEIRRDYFNDQTLPLAQTAEEAVMREEMQREAAQSLLRRAGYALRRATPADDRKS